MNGTHLEIDEETHVISEHPNRRPVELAPEHVSISPAEAQHLLADLLVCPNGS